MSSNVPTKHCCSLASSTIKVEDVPTKKHIREILLHYFILNKSAAEAHRMLRDVYGKHAPTDRTCRSWFDRFRNGDFDVTDKERPGQVKKFQDEELMALLRRDPTQTLKELAEKLNVGESTVSRRLKLMKMVQKRGNWTTFKK